MLAAGGAIDPFWAMYAQHQTAEVHKILEAYRIGDLVRSLPFAASFHLLLTCFQVTRASTSFSCVLSGRCMPRGTGHRYAKQANSGAADCLFRQRHYLRRVCECASTLALTAPSAGSTCHDRTDHQHS